MATEYGSRLRAARKFAKFTQGDLSKATGIPQSTISTAERLGNGSSETAVYAKACGVDAHWLATGEGAMEANTTSVVITPFPATTLEAVMERLSHYLAQVPQSHRKLSSEALAALALQPDDVARQTGILRLLVEPTVRADETATGTDHAQK